MPATKSERTSEPARLMNPPEPDREHCPWNRTSREVQEDDDERDDRLLGRRSGLELGVGDRLVPVGRRDLFVLAHDPDAAHEPDLALLRRRASAVGALELRRELDDG